MIPVRPVATTDSIILGSDDDALQIIGQDVDRLLAERDALRAKVAQLEADLLLWRPMTTAEAQAAYDAAEAIPVSDEEIERIVKFATDPAETLTNQEEAQLWVRVTKLNEEIRSLRADVSERAKQKSEFFEYIEAMKAGAGERIAELEQKLAESEAGAAWTLKASLEGLESIAARSIVHPSYGGIPPCRCSGCAAHDLANNLRNISTAGQSMLARVTALENELAGFKKSDELYRAGMESLTEQMHDLKQAARRATALEAERDMHQARATAHCRRADRAEQDAAEVSYRAAESVAGLLRDIAKTGKHVGTFGSPAIEEAAQAIQALHEDADRLAESVKHSLKWCAENSELWKDLSAAIAEHERLRLT